MLIMLIILAQLTLTMLLKYTVKSKNQPNLNRTKLNQTKISRETSVSEVCKFSEKLPSK